MPSYSDPVVAQIAVVGQSRFSDQWLEHPRKSRILYYYGVAGRADVDAILAADHTGVPAVCRVCEVIIRTGGPLSAVWGLESNRHTSRHCKQRAMERSKNVHFEIQISPIRRAQKRYSIKEIAASDTL